MTARPLSSTSNIMAAQAFARRFRTHYRLARLHGEIPHHRALTRALDTFTFEMACERYVGHDLHNTGTRLICAYCDHGRPA